MAGRLSGEARNRLTPEQKQLKLSYKILVSKMDLEPDKGDKPSGGKSPAKAASTDTQDPAPAARKGPARAPEPEQVREEEEPASRRPSAEDLAKAEEDYLKSLQDKP
jgi:hypothetical protein